MPEAWMLKLKAAYDAGYYRTETHRRRQTPFPWQNKTCKDCPFWLNNVCRVFASKQEGDAHTCLYFDSWNHEAAQHIIDSRMEEAARKWWEGFGQAGR